MDALSFAQNPYARAEQLENEIVDLCAQINAANWRLLQLIAELDDEAPWGAWGLASCAHFLNWRCGIGLNAAREKVRVAHALKTLPSISDIFRTGELSYSKVRALTRIANCDNESELLSMAQNATAAQVEQLVRLYRGVERIQQRELAEQQHEERELRYYYDEDGSLAIRARLPADQGALFIKAIEASMDDLANDTIASDARTDVETSTDIHSGDVTAVTSFGERNFPQRRADALTHMAESLLETSSSTTSSADRYTVMVHVSAETLTSESSGCCEIENATAISPDTARRVACDSGVIRVIDDENGTPLDVGRKTRVISPALRRALRNRDHGCRFPGCTRHRFVDAHHIVHWADGGATSLDNLVQLCRHHHRVLHEGGFSLERDLRGDLIFRRPDGDIILNSPVLPASHHSRLRTSNACHMDVIDGSDVIVPSDPLDYDFAISALVDLGERSTVTQLS